MKTYQLKRQQFLAIDPHQAWEFFSDPRNLAQITPPWLGFKICSDVPSHIHAGLIIQYRVSPIAGWSVPWTTEITQVRAPGYFVDEQRLGPYRFWHHQHLFEVQDGGVLMTDIVHYALPLWWIGRLIHQGMVQRKINEIFDYRHRVLAQRFGGGRF